MAVPTNREEFKNYCLRKLGAPVIEINVDDEQVEDRIDEALKYYADYHFDATERVYYKHQLTQEDMDNKYITIPENIMGVVKLMSPRSGRNIDTTEGMVWQTMLNDMFTHTSSSSPLLDYFMVKQNLELIDQIMIGNPLIRYARHKNKLYIDANWEVRYNVGDYLIVEAYEVVDPSEFPDVWGDRWLQNYATVLIEENWGLNLSKFVGMSLPGGLQFNGDAILQRALAKKEKMEEEMISSYSLPVMDMYG